MFDVGPFLRNYHSLSNINGLSFNEFLEFKKRETNNPNWIADMLQTEILMQYENGGRKKKDLIILGFRSIDDINSFTRRIQRTIFREKEIRVAVLNIELNKALGRYLHRESDKTETDFWKQIDFEKNWGIEEVKIQADIIIDNNGTLGELSENIGKYFK